MYITHELMTTQRSTNQAISDIIIIGEKQILELDKDQ